MKAVQADRHGNDSTPRPVARITQGSIDVAGRRRSYTLAEPPGAGPGTALVLVFHGSNQTGEKFRAFTGRSFDALASTGGAVVAYLSQPPLMPVKNKWSLAFRRIPGRY
jgi:poly(3-hydroxybutyrate) depolymerase